MNATVCKLVTDRIIEELEKGKIPWVKPWARSGGAISHSTGKPYSLLNQMLLGRPGEWLTFKQAQAEGGKIRKGEKGRPVVFWKQIAIQEEKDGEIVEKLAPVLRYYTVFHIDQTEGIEPRYSVPEAPAPVAPLLEAEAIITAYESKAPTLRIDRTGKSDSAYYSPALDYICVPCLEQYSRPEEYYSTLFHEMTHSTGHSSRLDRFKGSAACAAFGSAEYSKEELTAEIGAATLCNGCGIETQNSFRNSAAYIQGWLSALRNDNQMIITAAGKAEKAVNYILG